MVLLRPRHTGHNAYFCVLVGEGDGRNEISAEIDAEHEYSGDGRWYLYD
jgi:hypothetical protein